MKKLFDETKTVKIFIGGEAVNAFVNERLKEEHTPSAELLALPNQIAGYVVFYVGENVYCFDLENLIDNYEES